jgi:hypothetical protein
MFVVPVGLSCDLAMVDVVVLCSVSKVAQSSFPFASHNLRALALGAASSVDPVPRAQAPGLGARGHVAGDLSCLAVEWRSVVY